jgi:ABC-2 type transport system permease protein
MMALLWRPLPVMTLTIRQFIGGKAVRVVSALALLPAVFALIYLFNPDAVDRVEFLRDTILNELFFPRLLPITVLILATGALGNEIEDRTLPYLTLKPLSRLRIVVEKWLGAITVAIPIIALGILAACLIMLRGEAGDYTRLIAGAVAATAIGACAYSAIFIFISLVIQRALLFGIIYTFVLESILGNYLSGFRVISVSHYVTSIFERIQNDPEMISDNAAQLGSALGSAIIVLTVATVVSLLLATRRLRRMSLD